MVWADVQPAIAKITRACSYDRAGLGFSDPSPRASSAANTVDDLHALLHAAGIESPIILVGHSVGGAYVRLYADKYPSDVVGMVLVDPVHEDSMLWDAAADGGPDPRMLARYERFRKCSDADSALPRGFVPGTDLYKTCIFGPDSHFGPKLNAAGLAIEMKPSFQLAQLSEFSNGYSGVSFEQIREGRRFYGDMPLIVLSKTPDPSTLPKEQQTPQLRVLWELHEQLSALSMRGEHRGIANTGHDIQLDQPHAVIQAIKDVIALTAGGK
jgi:pimeloyl-ACP methyl ester carboxylesterase